MYNRLNQNSSNQHGHIFHPSGLRVVHPSLRYRYFRFPLDQSMHKSWKRQFWCRQRWDSQNMWYCPECMFVPVKWIMHLFSCWYIINWFFNITSRRNVESSPVSVTPHPIIVASSRPNVSCGFSGRHTGLIIFENGTGWSNFSKE
jgi:hypothetical protein